MAKRNIIKINDGDRRTHLPVDGSAKAIITEFADRLGLKEIALASRMYVWFSKQDDIVRKGVLGLLPEGYEEEVIKMALEHMAAEKRKAKK